MLFRSKRHDTVNRSEGLLFLAAFALTGCFETTDENYALPGRHYVAMGNSLTAGFQSGGLGEQYQEVSYPALLAGAMGINDFEQPLIESPGLGTSSDAQGNPRGPLQLSLDPVGLTYAALTKSPADMLKRRALPRPYNNLGVPGAMTVDVMKASSATTAYSYAAIKQPNPFFDIIMRGASLMNGASMLAQAIAQDPEIITLEIGNNDVLGGVTSGTVIIGVTVTAPPVFAALMNQIVDSLIVSTRAEIFLGNIPSITSIPYVTSLPPIILDSGFAPVLDAENQPIPLLTEEDSVAFVLFPALSRLLAKDGIPEAAGGTGKALPANLTLTRDEVMAADSAIAAYNGALDALEKKHDRVTVVDVNGLLKDLRAGKIAGLSSQHPLLQLLTGKIPNSAFSLDGIHPNAPGYRELAKIFLAAINGKMGSDYALK